MDDVLSACDIDEWPRARFRSQVWRHLPQLLGMQPTAPVPQEEGVWHWAVKTRQDADLLKSIQRAGEMGHSRASEANWEYAMQALVWSRFTEGRIAGGPHDESTGCRWGLYPIEAQLRAFITDEDRTGDAWRFFESAGPWCPVLWRRQVAAKVFVDAEHLETVLATRGSPIAMGWPPPGTPLHEVRLLAPPWVAMLVAVFLPSTLPGVVRQVGLCAERRAALNTLALLDTPPGCTREAWTERAVTALRGWGLLSRWGQGRHLQVGNTL
jgi:hypothetical protein